MTDKEVIEKCVTTFKLMVRFTESTSIKTDGKLMTVKEAVRFEAENAASKLEEHLGYIVPGPGLSS